MEPSLMDAITPYMDLNTALIFSQCSKQSHQVITQTMPAIIANDQETDYVRLYKYAGMQESLKEFIMMSQINQINVFESLMSQGEPFLRDWHIQSVYINKFVLKDSIHPKKIDSDIQQLIYIFIQVFDRLKNVTEKYLAIMFISKLLAQYIIWVIQRGNQDDPEISVFRSCNFWITLKNKLQCFSHDLHQLPKGEGSIKATYRHMMKTHTRYYDAVIHKFCDYDEKLIQLYIGSRGGVYTMKCQKRKYF